MHSSLPVGWRVSLSDGRVLYDWDKYTDDGTPSWFELTSLIRDNPDLKIRSMQLFNLPNFSESGEFAGAGVPVDNAEGYFFTKRMSAIMGETHYSGENFGVGYLKNKKVYITWFNQRVQALESEVRNEESCGFGLIINNE